MEESIILYDGVCLLCNRSVNIIIQHDPNQKFKFLSLQSPLAKGLLKTYHLNDDMQSIILIENKSIYTQADAVFRIARQLSGYPRLLSVFRFLPRFITNFFYRMVAKFRYKWFGKYEQCPIPSNEIKARFLDNQNI